MRNRTWKMLVVAALLGPAVTLTGCQSGGEGGPSEAAPSALASPVEIVEGMTGDSEALAGVVGVRLIKTQEQFDALGDPRIYPSLDFEEFDLVIASLGQRNTGGYAVEITALQQEGATLVVVGHATVPGEDAVTTQAITHPYAAAVIANTDATLAVSAID